MLFSSTARFKLSRILSRDRFKRIRRRSLSYCCRRFTALYVVKLSAANILSRTAAAAAAPFNAQREKLESGAAASDPTLSMRIQQLVAKVRAVNRTQQQAQQQQHRQQQQQQAQVLHRLLYLCLCCIRSSSPPLTLCACVLRPRCQRWLLPLLLWRRQRLLLGRRTSLPPLLERRP